MNTSIESTAYHEAGHAIMYIATDRKFKLVTIKPGKDTFGHILKASNHSVNSINHLFGECLRSYAGVIAECIYTGKMNHIGASSDYKNITNILFEFGLVNNSPTQRAFLKFLKLYATDIIKDRWEEQITVIANSLLIKDTLFDNKFLVLFYVTQLCCIAS